MQFFWGDFKEGLSGFCLVVISIFPVAKLLKLEKRLGAARVFSDEHSRWSHEMSESAVLEQDGTTTEHSEIIPDPI
jgi:hypothetical protein